MAYELLNRTAGGERTQLHPSPIAHTQVTGGRHGLLLRRMYDGGVQMHRTGFKRAKVFGVVQKRDYRAEDASRPEWRKLYKTARWLAIRAHQLMIEPLCRMCTARGVVTAATVCDHVEPHRGDVVKFFAGPFQSLCGTCHNSVKQSQERTGAQRGCDASGMPLDPSHPWRG